MNESKDIVVKDKKEPGILSFIGEIFRDDIRGISENVVEKILKPGIEKLIEDSLIGCVHAVFKHPVGSTSGTSNPPKDKVSYEKIFSGSSSSVVVKEKSSTSAKSYFDKDIYFKSSADAESALNQLTAMLNRYGVISCQDFCSVAGEGCHYTDNKWGWRNISSARVMRGSDGWYIDMPKAIPLDR